MNSEKRLNMADVGAKEATGRRAVARGSLRLGPEAYLALREKRLPKGDALAVAEVAAILAAKRTPETIPLCHPLALDFVGVRFEFFDGELRVCCHCEVRCRGVTGVEMEALAGVSAALLSIYDLCKPVDPALVIENIFLETKEGGKSGTWRHPALAREAPSEPKAHLPLAGVRFSVVTVSDSASTSGAADVSGPALKELASAAGAEFVKARCVPDDTDAIQSAVLELAAAGELVLCTGGTGLGPRDVTPEALRRISIKEVEGIGELLRKSGAHHTPAAWLSRQVAVLVSRAGETGLSPTSGKGKADAALVVAFPGKPAAVREGFEAVVGLVAHALHMIRGEGHGDNRGGRTT